MKLPLNESASIACNRCTVTIDGVFIQCLKCPNLQFCSRCSRTSVGKNHFKNSGHVSSIMYQESLSKHDPEWTAREERVLLDNVHRIGEETWGSLTQYIPGKTASQIEEHYNKYFRDELERPSGTVEEELNVPNAPPPPALPVPGDVSVRNVVLLNLSQDFLNMSFDS